MGYIRGYQLGNGSAELILRENKIKILSSVGEDLILVFFEKLGHFLGSLSSEVINLFQITDSFFFGVFLHGFLKRTAFLNQRTK